MAGHGRPRDREVPACSCRGVPAEKQLGLIAGGQFQDPLREGASVLSGSAGKTFSGPQSGVIVWNDPTLAEPLTTSIFLRTTEATRYGMGEREMQAIAGCIADVVFDRRAAEEVRKDVIALRRAFESLQYCCRSRRAQPAR